MTDRQQDQDPATLAASVAAGERDAEARLAVRYRRGVILMLRRWGAEFTLAEDLAQETLIAVIARLRERPLDDPARLDGFVRGVAHNLLRADSRARLRRRTSPVGELIDEFIDPDASPLGAAVRTDEAQVVRHLIDELPVLRDRELLRRHYLHGESKAQICDALGVDEAIFNQLLHRARRRLQQLLVRAGFSGL